MKKTSLATRNTFLSSSKVSWGTIALTAVLVVLLLRLFAPNVFWYAFTPVFRAGDTLAAKNHAFFSSFGNATELTLQNEKLTNENFALASENHALLQRVAQLSTLGSVRGITAGVVARPPESPYDTLVVAGGFEEGVTLGMEAFGAGGVPLGVVSSVLAHFSRVTLFSAPDRVTSGWVGRAGTAITITGEGGGAVSATISRSAGIIVGDTVYVPGPGMLPIGTVARIDGDPSSPSVTLRIQSTLNLFSVAWVLLRDTGAALLLAQPSATSTRR